MKRLQIEVSEQQLKDMEELMKKCGVSTKKELFNNAFVLLDWSVGEVEAGHVIASINEETERYRELQMPVLMNVKKQRSAKEKEESAAAVTAG